MNLLKQAHKLIKYEVISYLKFIGEIRTDLGGYIDQYDLPVNVKVKINAVSTKLYREFGLDYKRKFFILHVIPEISGLTRANSGDVFKYNNLTYRVESETGWQPLANWDSYLCVVIPDDGLST